MSRHFDIVVIGSGPGGYVGALKAAQLGASVAVIERGCLGGTCLNVGCIPSKALLASAHLLHQIRHASELGVTVGGDVSFDWAKIQSRKDRVIRMLQNGVKSLFAGRKIELIAGDAKLAGVGRVVVEGKAGAEEITCNNVILAVGSRPARIPGWPEDSSIVCTSDEALHWKTLPGKLLIVGGGIIGCEFACMMQTLGVEVTVVELMPRILPELDCHLAEAMQKILAKRGVKLLTGVKVQEMKLADAGAQAVLSDGQGVSVDRVLVAVGRRPATEGIGLDSVGLTVDRGFIRVDDHMQTPVKGVSCIGDANGRCLLAHAASEQGVVAAMNITGKPTVYHAAIPSCVYTFPEISSVGMTQEQAQAKKIPVSIGSFPIGYLGKAMAVGETEGFVKVIRHRESGELLGIHMLGHNVTELIAAAGAMLHHKLSVREVADVVYAHPTISESLKEAAEDSLGEALHLPPRKVIRIGAQ